MYECSSFDRLKLQFFPPIFLTYHSHICYCCKLPQLLCSMKCQVNVLSNKSPLELPDSCLFGSLSVNPVSPQSPSKKSSLTYVRQSWLQPGNPTDALFLLCHSCSSPLSHFAPVMLVFCHFLKELLLASGTLYMLCFLYPECSSPPHPV